MKTFANAVALTILLATAASAQEPRAWTYTALLTGDKGSAFVSAGSGARHDIYEPGGFRHYNSYTMLTQASNLGPQSGNARVTLGSTPGHSSFHWVDEATMSVPIDSHFTASITVYDSLSGESGTASFTGTALSPDSYLGLPADLNLPNMPAVWELNETSREFTLGGQRYQVRLGQIKVNEYMTNEGGDWDSLEVVADVVTSTETPPETAPEPGTIALAALGLTGAWGVRQLRRSGRLLRS